MSRPDDEAYDALIAQQVYPEAAGAFFGGYRSLAEVVPDCIVVVDTNALLVPYGTGHQSLHDISAKYRLLAGQGRLVIPGQVAREFARNRPRKLGELYQAFSRKRDQNKFQRGRYPLLEENESYKKVVSAEAQIDRLLDEYKTALSDVMEHIRSWTWDDPVSKVYSEVFSREGVVREIQVDDEEVRKRLKHQNTHKIPPGYKDGGKDDAGIGDNLIWRTIVDVGSRSKKHVILVSGDNKPDWWYQSERQPLYPRFELLDEFRRASGGRTFHIVSFASFLELFGADKGTVAEVREEELLTRLFEEQRRDNERRSLGFSAETAVASWLIARTPHWVVSRQERFNHVDFLVSDPAGATTGVLVTLLTRSDPRRLKDLLTRARQWLERDKSADNCVVFAVCTGAEVAGATIQKMREEERGGGASLVVATLEDGRLVDVLDFDNALPAL